MALQQNQGIAEILGIRPRGSAMSHNELSWWAAYRSIVPFDQHRFDIYDSRNIGLHANKSPSQVMLDWFSPLNNPEWLENIKNELQEERRKRLEKEAEHGKNN